MRGSGGLLEPNQGAWLGSSDVRKELWWQTNAKLMTEMDRTRLVTLTMVN